MRIAFFVHALASDWNHGNAHFVRGVCSELVARGHTLTTHEQRDNWSTWHLKHVEDVNPEAAFAEAYPSLVGIANTFDVGARPGTFADPDFADVDASMDALDLPTRLAGVDAVIVHEWTPPGVVAALGCYRQRHDDFRLLFHDTHHRAVSEPEKMSRFDISGYDGVLVFGDVLRDAYLRRGWDEGRVVTWHEAADTRVFKPLDRETTGDVVWVGNWGDNERTAELHEFLLEPVRRHQFDGLVHGVRYPDDGIAAVERSGLAFAGYLPNHRAPDVFARHRLTVHVPRRWYVTHLPGIPTIRVFEALACGIPLVSAPWQDSEELFTPGSDFLVADSGKEMAHQMHQVLHEKNLAEDLAAHGLETIRARHTCAHRVDELEAVLDRLS
ncbi:MAG: glycosyltransferase [Planctomycetota bacterium]